MPNAFACLLQSLVFLFCFVFRKYFNSRIQYSILQQNLFTNLGMYNQQCDHPYLLSPFKLFMLHTRVCMHYACMNHKIHRGLPICHSNSLWTWHVNLNIKCVWLTTSQLLLPFFCFGLWVITYSYSHIQCLVVKRLDRVPKVNGEFR